MAQEMHLVLEGKCRQEWFVAHNPNTAKVTKFRMRCS